MKRARSENRKDACETADVIAEYRKALRKENPWGADDTRTAWINTESAMTCLDRIDAAWKHDRDKLIYSYDPTKAEKSRPPDGVAYEIEGLKRDPAYRDMLGTKGNMAALRDECAIMNVCNRALAERPQTVLSRMETLGRLKEELEFCENNLKRDVGLSPFGLARHCEVLREIVVALEAHEEGGAK